MAEVRGLQERLKGGGLAGEPSAYQGSMLFEPESQTYTVVQPQNQGSTWTVNYVVRDGQTYDIPIMFPGPGIFVARRMEVSILQRLRNIARPEADLLVARSLSTLLAAMARDNASPGFEPSTLDGLLRQFRYSLLWDWWTEAQGSPQREDPVPAINYFWNLWDSKSQRYLASELMSHLALMPISARTTRTVSTGRAFEMLPADGGAFDFEAPLVVERDGQISFKFRPITAVYQIDSAIAPSLAQTGYTFLDREGLKRKQSVLVQVELYGERYETLQDAMKQGALTRPVRKDER